MTDKTTGDLKDMLNMLKEVRKSLGPRRRHEPKSEIFHVVSGDPEIFRKKLQDTLDRVRGTRPEGEHICQREVTWTYDTTFNGSGVTYSSLIEHSWMEGVEVGDDEEGDDLHSEDSGEVPFNPFHPLIRGASTVD